MAVPEEIRKVPRPKNTYVQASGKNKDRYSVIERLGCKRIGNRSIPINGRTVGHIIDGVYVAIHKEEEPIEKNETLSVDLTSSDELYESSVKDWANVELCEMVIKDLYEPLCQMFGKDKATTFYLTSILKVCNPFFDTVDCIEMDYQDSFLTSSYPSADLSIKSITSILREIKNDKENVIEFIKTHTDLDPETIKAITSEPTGDFLTRLLKLRLENRFREKGYLENNSFSQLMMILERAKKIKRSKEKWELNSMSQEQLVFLYDMGLDVNVPGKKQRGRKRTNKEKDMLEQKRVQDRGAKENGSE